MQKWLYYPDMQRCNPVCVDAGEITEIRPRTGQFWGADSIVADGIIYSVDTKWTVFRSSCYCSFFPLQRADGGEIKGDILLPKNILPRQAVTMDGITGYRGMFPICIDPRVMYIVDKGFSLVIDRSEEPSPDEIKAYLADIPSMEKAVEYLKTKDFLINNCIHDDGAGVRAQRIFEATNNGKW